MKWNMPDPEKIIEELRQNPIDIRFETLQNLLLHKGYRLTHRRGSHFRFKKEGKTPITIVAHNRKVKKWYVLKIITLLSHE